jgi:DNA-binding IclR family transcriptional regulator
MGQGDLVEAVSRALALLDAFTIDDASLRLTELARRAKLPKSSTLRLARTLAASGYLAPTEAGTWRLGPSTAWLGARYQVGFDIHQSIGPEMQALATATGRSVSYFVHDGRSRIRLLYVPGPSLEDNRHRRVGEPMPLERGSPGQVLLAFAGQAGSLYDSIRKRGFHYTIGEARSGGASISAPVLGSRWNVVGALCIGIPASEATESVLLTYAPALLAAAKKLSRTLAKQQASIPRLVQLTRRSLRRPR